MARVTSESSTKSPLMKTRCKIVCMFECENNIEGLPVRYFENNVRFLIIKFSRNLLGRGQTKKKLHPF